MMGSGIVRQPSDSEPLCKSYSSIQSSWTTSMPVGRTNWSRCPDSDGCMFVFLTRANSYTHSRTNSYAIKC